MTNQKLADGSAHRHDRASAATAISQIWPGASCAGTHRSARRTATTGAGYEAAWATIRAPGTAGYWPCGRVNLGELGRALSGLDGGGIMGGEPDSTAANFAERLLEVIDSG